MKQIVVATSNPHKVEEMRAIFSPLGIDLMGLQDLDVRVVEPREVGRTFEENARIKAESYAAQTGRLCIADDSGLEVDALGGEPGVISSHYCNGGEETQPPMSRVERDHRNNELVLRKMKGVPEANRGARFVCVMALGVPAGLEWKGERLDRAGVVLTARGEMEGRIGEAPGVPRGRNGFGYDPLFLVGPNFKQTSAELEPREKNRLSHRGAAARRLAELIAES